MDSLDDIIDDAKKWIPYVKRPPFAGLDSVKPRTLDEQISESKKRNRLKKSLLDLLTVYSEGNFPDELLRLRFRQVIAEWAKENDEQLCAYLTLLYQQKFALANYRTTRDEKWRLHFHRKSAQIEAFEQEYRPAPGIMKFWWYGL